MKRLLILPLAILLVLCVIPLFTPEAEAIGKPVVTISMDQPWQEAYVEPGMGDEVVFTGVVNVVNLVETDGQSVTVNLIASAEGYPLTLVPETMIFTENGNQTFELTVYLPDNARGGANQVNVSGRSKNEPGIPLYYSVPPALSVINVNEYYGMSVSSMNTDLEAGAGDTVQFKVDLHNEGNSEDTIYVDVTDGLSDLERLDCTVEVNSYQHEVGYKEDGLLTIEITVPEYYVGDAYYPIQVNAYSQNAKDAGVENAEDDISLVLYLYDLGAADDDIVDDDDDDDDDDIIVDDDDNPDGNNTADDDEEKDEEDKKSFIDSLNMPLVIGAIVFIVILGVLLLIVMAIRR